MTTSLAGGAWEESLVESWATGAPLPDTHKLTARLQGLPERPPADPIQRVRLLALLTQADHDQIVRAARPLNDWEVEEVIDRIPSAAYSIIDFHRMGATPLEIARQAGITRSLVYYWLKQVGWKPHRRNRAEMSARERDEVLAAYEAGEPMSSIARRHGLTYDQVRYAVRSVWGAAVA